MDEEKLQYFSQRVAEIAEVEEIIAFPEIKISDEQLEAMAEPMFGWGAEHLKEYYKRKVHGEILLSKTPLTSREEHQEFQYIFDLGVKALSMGIEL